MGLPLPLFSPRPETTGVSLSTLWPERPPAGTPGPTGPGPGRRHGGAVPGVPGLQPQQHLASWQLWAALELAVPAIVWS